MGSFNKAPNHLSGLLTLLARLIKERLDEGLRPLGVSYAQAAALVRLWRSDGTVLQRDLVSSLALSRATGTLLITDLEVLGLVTRSADPTDLRRQVVSLTPRGQELEQPVFDVIQAVQADLLTVLDERELERTIGALTRVLGHLEPDALFALPEADRPE